MIVIYMFEKDDYRKRGEIDVIVVGVYI